MLVNLVLVIVLACAALGVILWAAFGGVVLVRNVVALGGLAWEAVTAIPALLRVARRKVTGGRAP